jgi:uncharacterized protein YukE
MAQIRIDTDYAREVGRKLKSCGDRIDDIGLELQGAIGRLDTWAWDGQSRSRAEPMLNRVRRESESVARGLGDLGHKLQCVADMFEREDATAAQNLGGMPWVNFEHAGGAASGGAAGSMLGWALGGLVGLGVGAIEVSPNVWEGIQLVPTVVKVAKVGDAVSGLTGNTFADAWNLGSKHLVRGANQLTTPKFSPSMLGVAVEVAFEIKENWEEYEGDPAKIVTGVLVDTAIGVGCSLVGGAAGTFVGAALGSLAGPAGTVIGAKIGGFVGSWVGGQVAEWLENRKIGGRELDQLIVGAITDGGAAAARAVGDAAKGVGRAVGDAAEGIGRAAAGGARRVGKALGSFAGSVASLF